MGSMIGTCQCFSCGTDVNGAKIVVAVTESVSSCDSCHQLKIVKRDFWFCSTPCLIKHAAKIRGFESKTEAR